MLGDSEAPDGRYIISTLMVDLGVFMLYEFIGGKIDSSYRNISIDYIVVIRGIKTML